MHMDRTMPGPLTSSSGHTTAYCYNFRTEETLERVLSDTGRLLGWKGWAVVTVKIVMKVFRKN